MIIGKIIHAVLLGESLKAVKEPGEYETVITLTPSPPAKEHKTSARYSGRTKQLISIKDTSVPPGEMSCSLMLVYNMFINISGQG